MSYTAAQIASVRAKAVEIAIRGVTYIQIGDRSHKFTSAMELEKFALQMEGQMLDDTHNGLIDIKFVNPS